MTGAGGFIGRHVVDRLRERGDDVVAVEHRWTGPDELAAAVGAGPIHRALHLGWPTAAGERLDTGVHLEGFRAAVEVVELLTARGCSHLVGAGTGAEYAPAERALRETDPVGPIESYSTLKAALGGLLTRAKRIVPFPVAWARVFTPVGESEPPTRVLPAVARALLCGEPIDVTDCAQQVEMLDVHDVATALVALSDLGANGCWNVASGDPHRLRDLVVGIAERVGNLELVRFGARPRDAWTRSWYVGDSTELRIATGWAPAFDTEAVLDRVSEDWRRRVFLDAGR